MRPHLLGLQDLLCNNDVCQIKFRSLCIRREKESTRQKNSKLNYPVKPVVIEAMSPRPTSLAKGSSFLETWTFRMASRPTLSGAST
jgi:hypothetical protein